MILELKDGRELKLPDNMDDETARQLGKLILGLEKRAEDAEARAQVADSAVSLLRTNVETLRAEVRSSVVDLTPLQNSIVSLQQMMEAQLKQVVAAQLADRIMVPDELGTPRSRAVMKPN